MVSSTQRLQNFIFRRLGISDLSNSIMNMSANKGARGDPIATPSNWIKICPLKVKLRFLVQSKSSSFISFLVNDVVNSWLVYILLRIMSIVVSKGTLRNSELTSNDSIWNPSGTFLRLIISIKCLVLLMVYSDSLKRDNIFDKCFANWYVAVFKFDTIDLIGSWCLLPFPGTLWILTVLYNFPGDDPDGYRTLYSCSDNVVLIFLNILWIFPSAVFVGSLSSF